MQTLSRIVAAAALALWLAIPGVSGIDTEVGGENAGGTGVWILPRSTALTSNSPLIGMGVQSRSTLVIEDLSRSAVLAVGSECGEPVAILFDRLMGAPIALPVVGLRVTLPAETFRALIEAEICETDIVVIDANNRGYVMRLCIDLSGRRAQLHIF